jgi:hypothetical protein
MVVTMEQIRRNIVMASVVALLALGSSAGFSVVRAAVPTEHQRVVYQRICQGAADGTLSDQEALVCTHSGFPQWRDADLDLLERVCRQVLGGDFVYRSEFPTEFAACFFG